MTGRHAAAESIDDEALADQPREPGAHRADVEAAPAPSTKKPSGRRTTTPKEKS